MLNLWLVMMVDNDAPADVFFHNGYAMADADGSKRL